MPSNRVRGNWSTFELKRPYFGAFYQAKHYDKNRKHYAATCAGPIYRPLPMRRRLRASCAARGIESVPGPVYMYRAASRRNIQLNQPFRGGRREIVSRPNLAGQSDR